MAGRNAYEGGTHNCGCVEKTAEAFNLARSDSMDVGNDPRFFQDNVVNYRLAAFGALSVVSGLLVQNAMSALFDMNKNMGLIFPVTSHIDSAVQIVSFTFLVACFFMNMIATYVGVAQPYHTIRLMTSGPTGFEAATSYYLNANIVLWRHSAIKAMLLSLPLFCMQMGLRLVVKFDRGTMDYDGTQRNVPMAARIQGFVFCGIFVLMSLVLWYVHHKHFRVFRDRYRTMMPDTNMITHMQTMMQPSLKTGGMRPGGLDV